jgi:hypothetical protein
MEKPTPPPEDQKLPLWRLIAAILVLVAMVAVLLTLAPVYYEDFQLRQYIQTLTRGTSAATTQDEVLRAAVSDRGRQLDLPIRPEDIQISRTDGKLQVQIKYSVQMDFPLYQVDLHFHPSATSR